MVADEKELRFWPIALSFMHKLSHRSCAALLAHGEIRFESSHFWQLFLCNPRLLI